MEEKLYNILRNILGDKDEIKLEMAHIYDISYNEKEGIRVDCDMGSFSLIKDNAHESYNYKTDEWEIEENPYYWFDGFYSDDYPEFPIQNAVTLINKLK